MSPLRPSLLLALFLPALAPAAPPVGFEEKFALAADRAALLKELIPGTPEFYYYSALHSQNAGNAAETARLLKEWATRFPEANNQRTLLETRQHFLDYATDPQATLAWLKETRGLNFDHARETAGTPAEIPTALDPALITWDAFYAQAVSQDPKLGTLTDSGLRALFHRGLAKDLPAETRRAVLPRLTRPDLPGLTEFILADLETRESQGFGEFPIHRNLLLAQLETLLTTRPKLLENRAFVETWLPRLAPPDGLDPDHDPAVRLAWLERLQAFAATLPPAFNTIKASVLYQRLAFDLKQNTPDAARLVAYLKLPRPVPYLNPLFRERQDLFRNQADLSTDLTALTGQGPITDDTALVRRTLLILLAKNPDPGAFQPWLEASFLNALLAEAQLTTQPATADQFTALLQPAALQQLRTRTDLEFDPACRETWLPEDEVTLDLHLKNIPRLLVKVFEINTENVHRSTGRQVNTDLDLDGLVANRESSQDYDSPPLQRVRRTFKFPELNGKRGVWIIEFIGGGKSSRALVRKGGLTVLPIQTGAGTRLTILDEKSAPLPTAYALLGSQRFPADAQGHVLLPFSTTPGEQNVIIHDGSGFTTLESIELQGETYTLNAGLHVPRESLLPGRTATALFRPALLCNGRPTTLTALENPKLTLTATTLEGIPSTTVFPLKDLSPDQETTISFQVPDRLATLAFEVSGEVKSLLTSQPVPVTADHVISVNSITLSRYTSDLQLTPGKDGWSLSELGRTGEPLADHQLNLTATHRDLTNSIAASLRTAANGSVTLGNLQELTALSVSNSSGHSRDFTLPRDNSSQPYEVHAGPGEPIRLAWPWQIPAAANPVARPVLTLLETRNGHFIRNIIEGIAFKNGFVEITGLAPGTYSLFMEEKTNLVTLRVSNGKAVDGHLLNPSQTLELSGLNPVAITGLTPGKITPKEGAEPVDALTINVANADPTTRVHVLVSRFLPEFNAFPPLADNSLPALTHYLNPWYPSLYQSARTIGEEYRYVLERQSLKSFAGNLLPRPGLLLNPWAIADTTTEKQEAAVGEAPAAMEAERKRADKSRGQLDHTRAKMLGDMDTLAAATKTDGSASPPGGNTGSSLVRMPTAPDLSFLAQPGATAFNLKPDANGNVHIATAALGHGQFLRVIALSGDSAAVRDFTLPDKPLQTRDLRLAKGLDPAGHFTQQNAVTVLEKDVPFTLKDALSSRFQAYGNLSSAWDLLSTLSQDGRISEFAFIRDWQTYDDARKHEIYKEAACHELNFFLSRKDPAFFKAVILPFLANKRDQTFLDHYLLDQNLDSWRDLPRYSKLNTAEKLLFARAWDKAHLKLEVPNLTAASRDLTDFLNTLPRDPAKEVFWFESALGRGQLEQANTDGIFNIGQDSTSAADSAPADPFSRGGVPAAPATAGMPELAVKLQAVEAHDLKDTAAMAGRRGLAENEFLLRQVAKQKGLYRQTELTKEWAENNYWKLPIADQNAELMKPNRFWKDYALWDGQTPFLSANLSEAANSFSEIMLALAVLDLPLEADAKPAKSELKDGVLTLTPSARSLLFHQEIKAAELDKDGPPLLVSQNFYREGDRYLQENGEKSDKFVSGEFLTGTVYGCQIVVTNPGSARRKLEVLFQIPTGSLPVQQTRITQSIPVQLDAFHTQTLDFLFYFPKPGAFTHYPVHVSRDGKVAASAAPATFKVVDTLTTLDKTSWDYLSQQGTAEEVLAYLDQHNLHQTNLDRIAWRLKDGNFYSKLTALLRSRKYYQETVFSYSLLHNDLPVLRDYLASHGGLPEEPLDSPLLTIDPIEQNSFQWLEYSPLVNARAHQLGGDRVILNDRFRSQYSAFLHLLSFRPAFTDAERLGLTAVLLLQDRLDEASAWFSKVDPAKIHERLQYDYLQAWLAFSAEDLPTARSIATARISTPLPDHWLAKFKELSAQLDEIDGKTPAAPRPEDRDATQDRLAAAEPQFALKVESKAVILDYRNLTEVTVNYYPMDLEFLFSANPFVGQDTSRFRSIRPNQTEHLTLAPGKNAHTFPLPAAWQNTNVLVEITAAGQTKAVASYANQLDVQISENYGQLQVRHAGDQRPLPRSYVKVFAEIDGKPTFYKDGYTDLRGKFDYTSLSTADLDKTTRFSLLILTPDHGATVREVKPPAR
ncbi:MAG: hypothetical protein V4675_20250 [Verrucomicrobiota bacterium]